MNQNPRNTDIKLVIGLIIAGIGVFVATASLPTMVRLLIKYPFTWEPHIIPLTFFVGGLLVTLLGVWVAGLFSRNK